MRILFVRPHMFAARAHDAMQPLVFAILKGLTPAEHETVLYDERLEDVPLDEPADLVAMTVETYTARRAYQIARAYRRRGVPVVLGGYHATLATDEALHHADAVVRGDAEDVWPGLLEDVAGGRLQRLYQGGVATSLEGVRYDRGIFAGKRYSPYSLVQFHRGCRYACDFCSIRAFYGSSSRSRPVHEVTAEIRALESRAVFFADDNMVSDPAAAAELMEALIPLDVLWGAQVTMDIAGDDSYLDLMARSGCRAVLIGFESLDADSLHAMKKGWMMRQGPYEETVRRIHARGIMIYGTFVFGYDQDTVESFEASLQFALRSRFFLANFNPLTPTPGVPLYDRLKREGRLVHDPWWLNPDFRYGHATFHPRNMTADQLTAACYRTRSRFYGLRSIANRGLGLRTNFKSLPLYVGANWMSRREIHTKQGRALGGDSVEAHADQAQHRPYGALALRRRRPDGTATAGRAGGSDAD